MRKLFFVLFCSLTLFINSQNAWKVGEVGGFTFTASYDSDIVITRADNLQFNVVLNPQETSFFVGGLNEWLRLDSVYDGGLNAIQKYITTVHKQNDSIAIIFSAAGMNRKMYIDFSTITPYRLSTYILTKSEVSDIIKVIEDCKVLSNEKKNSIRKLN